MRLQKYISQCGVMSRRKAEEAILEGRVTLNGKPVTEMGVVVDPGCDEVCVDGKSLSLIRHKKTFLFYKPRGVVTTKSDEKGRKCVMDFFKDIPSLNPVGRLDLESEGLMLLTHDGDLALRLTHPRYGVVKVYQVKVAPLKNFIPAVEGQTLIHEAVQQWLSGVVLEDGVGKFLKVIELKPFIFEIQINEGRNRFIRRMCHQTGYQVLELKRIQMGEYRLGHLKPGERLEV